ncbi:hypothetical protein F53441_8449 [Fusarium austroafricanum]|uniref:Uncharacterized protein n=1 Tax=Fusarium austroafricanum TaxID=2364996 RepID=A0A8H4KEI2_9HYPO|nr:hypothetical protein F53441_8449 [Fusarium austroafricanum]
MASNRNTNEQPLDDETRDDLRRMTEGLTHQTTIETLSRAGMMAKNKREDLRSQAAARDEAAKKEAAEKEAEEENKDDTTNDKENT